MSFQNVNTELALHFNNIYCTISIRIFMALVFIFLCHRFFKFCQSLRSSHIKLNCWYCNCDSYILRRGGQTLKHWQCTFCGSENARSQSGEILDPQPLVTKEQLTRSSSFHTSKPSPKSKYSLCNECQEKQELKLKELCNYIPDENDPNYKKRCKTAYAYREVLDKQYKLCETCESMLAQVKVKETMSFSNTRLQLLLDDNARYGIPIIVSTKSHIKSGAIWLMIHLTTILYLIHAYYHPPSASSISILRNLYSRIIDGIATLPKLSDTSSLLAHILLQTEGYILSVTKRIYEHKWNLEEWAVELLILNCVSYQYIYWHPLWKTVFTKANRLLYWKEYTITQSILFISRFALIIHLKLPAVCLVLYLIALVYSTWNVRIKGRYLVLAPKV